MASREQAARRLAALLAVLLAGVLAAVLAGCGGGGQDAGAKPSSPPRQPDGRLTVDLLYLNHGPVQELLGDIDKVLSRQSGKIAVKRHDAESAEGRTFAQQHGLAGHVPIAILIGGKVEAQVQGRAVSFKGFPKGRAPIASAEGNWTLDDLEGALKQQTGQG